MTQEQKLEIVGGEQQEASSPPEVETYFVVFKDPANGRWTANSSVKSIEFILPGATAPDQVVARREATMDDFYVASASVMRDVSNFETANQVMGLMAMRAAQAQQAMQDRQILESLQHNLPNREQRRHP